MFQKEKEMERRMEKEMEIEEETRSSNKRRMSRESPEQRMTFSSSECEKSVVAGANTENIWT